MKLSSKIILAGPPRPSTGIGSTIGDYKLTKIIGFGEYGAVYEGKHVRTGRIVAIKALYPEKNDSTEIESTLKLDHPHIPKFLSVIKTEGRTYIVMKKIEGITLDVGGTPRKFSNLKDLNDVLQLARNRLDISDAIRIFTQIGSALDHAHQQGYAHRDVKPDNILIGSHGDFYLGDWGLSRPLNDYSQGIGGLSYVSPEVTDMTQRIGSSSDFYSLASVVFEALTGIPPLQTSEEDLPLSVQIIRKTPPDFEELPDKTPEYLRVLLEECLQKDPAKRPSWETIETYLAAAECSQDF